MNTHEKGIYTEIAKGVQSLITQRDFVTSDGECIELDESVINTLTCDITNMLLNQERKNSSATYFSIKKENSSIHNVGGYFYHLLFKNLLEKDFEENYMVRFMKLCTHLNYDNVLVQGEKNGQTKLLEKDLEKVLNLSERELRNTKKYLIENNLIEIDKNGVIRVNKDYAIRGKVKGDNGMTRVFIDGFNELYDGVSPRQHKQLATFIKILPYLNSEFNIICENPDETDANLVKPLSWVELAEKIGLEKKQAYNLKTKLFKLRINGKKVIAEWKDNFDTVKLVVNPAIFWKANQSKISDVAKIFEI